MMRILSARPWALIVAPTLAPATCGAPTLMLSPSQAYFLRENLKLRLLNARLALLSRNEVGADVRRFLERYL